MAHVSVIGNSVVDLYAFGLDDWPKRPGERSLIQQGLKYFAGGTGLNVAMSLAFLGHEVHFFTAIGRGDNAKLIRKNVQNPQMKGKIHLHEAPLTDEGQNHTSLSLVRSNQDGSAEFVHYPGASLFLKEAFLKRGEVQKILGTSSGIYFGGLELTGLRTGIVGVLERAKTKEQNIPVFADVTLQSESTSSTGTFAFTFLDYVDYFFPNDDEALQYSSKQTSNQDLSQPADKEQLLLSAARTFNLHVRRATVVTRGANGVTLYPKDGNVKTVTTYSHVSNFKLVDTVGAGDAFVAGCMSGNLNGEGMVNACKIGNAVAAHVVQSYGGWTPIMNFTDMKQWALDNYDDEIELA